MMSRENQISRRPFGGIESRGRGVTHSKLMAEAGGSNCNLMQEQP